MAAASFNGIGSRASAGGMADLARHGPSRTVGSGSGMARHEQTWRRRRQRLQDGGVVLLPLVELAAGVAPDAATARFAGRAHRCHRTGRVVVVERDGEKEERTKEEDEYDMWVPRADEEENKKQTAVARF
uniref:Uncharacterized protein n=1 Tax=Oryza nivara TaxID=4536 RepID=A0A0E0IGM6_ORYNI